ncbi:M23 family metallopeptidase [Streptomyces sp. NPDC049881]|uniref:murein hydrolase activator EnvC family protein n=1 Tax=Streptomyces sp. NPDC049881 TaxID=3155778 RepID=UPI00341B83F4
MLSVIASPLVVLLLLLSVPASAAPASDGAADGEGLPLWPVPGADGGRRPAVDRAYDPPPAPWQAGHRGVDLLTDAGAPVRAAGPGRVTFAGQVAGRGVVTVELDGSGAPPVRITHEPLAVAVTTGDRVAAGALLGTLAAGPGHCAAPCLHWGATRDGAYLDPLTLLRPDLLRAGPSRLLPTTGVPLPAG